MKRFLVIWTALTLMVTAGSVSSAEQDLRISVNPSRPLVLYQAPSTYRRDARGHLHPSIIIRAERPVGPVQTPAVGSIQPPAPSVNSGENRDGRAVLRPIVVTSSPFGFGSFNNEIVKQPTTTKSTTTTTEAPFFDGKAPSTIPFFSISCTMGSSCSQIIAARQTKTPKPTFKPYTKEDIDKAKGSLYALFPPSMNHRSSTIPSTSTTTTTTTTPAPSTTTTKKPMTSFRIRTTTAPFRRPSPVYIRTSVPVIKSTTTKYPDLWSQWRWPPKSSVTGNPTTTTEKSIDRNQYLHSPASQTSAGKPSTQAKPNLSTWTLAPNPSPATTTIKPNKSTTQKPTSSNYQGSWLSLLSATLNGMQKTPKPTKSAVTPTPPPVVQPPHQVQSYVPVSAEWNDDPNSLAWRPESADKTVGMITLRQPALVNTHEIISTKGNKISLITGVKRPAVNPTPSSGAASNFQLPPEVSISSHMIGLKVKPKSLSGFERPHVQQVQGVQIETDGQDVNLSHLIMKEKLVRPARYLTSLITRYGRGFPSPVQPTPDAPSSPGQWQFSHRL